MHHFLASIPWRGILGVAAILLTAFLSFYFGRRWNRGIKAAKAYRNQLEQTAAAYAVLKAQTTQAVHVESNPVIQIGSELHTDLHLVGQRARSVHGDRPVCAFCGRAGCRADCREALNHGPIDEPIRHLLHGLSDPATVGLASPDSPSFLGHSLTDRLSDRSILDGPGYELDD